MTASAHGSPAALDLSLEEAWVVHAALLHRIERETADGGEAREECDVLEKLERTDAFDRTELRLLRAALVSYLGAAPLRDRAACRRVLDGVRTALA